MVFTEKVYYYLKANAPQDVVDQYLEYNPPPKKPTTLTEALADVKEQSAAEQSQSVGPWYGLRHRIGLTCTQEYRMEHILRYYL